MTAYEELLEKAYELYKADWCASRGYDLALVQETELKDEEYNGEMYASLGEFEDCEFTDEEYMRALIGEGYDNAMSKIAAEEKYPVLFGYSPMGKQQLDSIQRVADFISSTTPPLSPSLRSSKKTRKPERSSQRRELASRYAIPIPVNGSHSTSTIPRRRILISFTRIQPESSCCRSLWHTEILSWWNSVQHTAMFSTPSPSPLRLTVCGILFGFRQGAFSNAQGQSQYQAGGSLP